MSLGTFLPLLIALALAAVTVASTLDERVRRPFARLALALFGGLATRHDQYRTPRVRRLRASLRPTTYRTYAVETLLYSALAALIGGIVGLYVSWGLFRLLVADPETVRAALPAPLAGLVPAGLETVGTGEVLAVLGAGGLAFGLVAGVATYGARWRYPAYRAGERARAIDAGMPQAVAFVYALSRSGMAFPTVLRVLADHRPIYGQAAVEIDVVVRHMDLFGQDAATALETVSRRTPSEGFAEFAENLASVLRSGRSLPEFLRAQYEEFQTEAEAQQRQLLDLLSTIAEAYVTVFVAGPLFLITILVVFGVTTGETLPALRLVTYVVLPLGNLAFAVYLDSVTGGFGAGGRLDGGQASPRAPTGPRGARGSATEAGPAADRTGNHTSDDGRVAAGASRTGTGGPSSEDAGANVERLRLYRRLRWLRESLGRPVATVVERPVAALYAIVPLAVLATAIRLVAAPALSVEIVDDLLVQAALFVLGAFAVVYELHRRRIDAIEAAIPDLLDRLASVNEAGMSLVESLRRVRSGDLGALDREVDRLWTDVRWGATIGTALARFERRVGTRTVSRVVALLTNAMSASGNVSEVLRIAAEQAKADRRLDRRRRQEMLSYLVVVYVSFGVFLLIVVVLTQVLIPTVPDGSVLPDATAGSGVPETGGIGQFRDVATGAYALVLFHALLIQGVLSGVVAGQMSTGDIRGGAKHAATLLAAGYAVFLVL